MSRPDNNIQRKGSTDWLVHPTGTYPTDVTNVQWAVDNAPPGAVILLKATDEGDNPQYFHFGDDTSGRGAVNVRQDVAILGEPAKPQVFVFPNGKTPDSTLTPDRTVVYGGQKPFQCCDLTAPAAALTIRHVFFAYPAQSAVHLKKSSGLEVSDCIVYDIKRAATGIPDLVVAVGIEATGLKQASPTLEGHFRVFNNTLKRSEDLDYGRADCGIVLQLASMKAHIYGNTISNFALAGIAIDGNRADTIIEKNDVAYCGYGQEVPQSGGIGVKRSTKDFLGISVKVSITNNRIIAGAVAGPSNGMFTSRNGISLWGTSTVTVKSNLVTGTVSSDGILLTSFASGTPNQQRSTYDSIVQNDLRALVAGHAQEFLDKGCDHNESKSNDLGAVDLAGSGVAGIVVHSDNNQIVNESFHGNYPGTAGSPKVPCVWLTADTRANTVTALKRGKAFPAFDLCSQVQNDSDLNDVPGYSKCARVTRPEILQREKQHCLREGGAWSEATHTCTLVEK